MTLPSAIAITKRQVTGIACPMHPMSFTVWAVAQSDRGGSESV